MTPSEGLVLQQVRSMYGCNWASEANPTLGYSIEISRDIYMLVCMSVCLQKIRMSKCVGRITWPQTHACSKSGLGS